MYTKLIAEILLAFFAVFGLYALIRLFVTSRCLPREIGAAVEIRQGMDMSELPLLLRSVADCAFLCGGRFWALVDASLAGDAPLLRVLREQGARICFVLFEEKD